MINHQPLAAYTSLIIDPDIVRSARQAAHIDLGSLISADEQWTRSHNCPSDLIEYLHVGISCDRTPDGDEASCRIRTDGKFWEFSRAHEIRECSYAAPRWERVRSLIIFATPKHAYVRKRRLDCDSLRSFIGKALEYLQRATEGITPVSFSDQLVQTGT